MLGKGLFKLAGFAVTGALALAGGAQLLSSVASVVFALRAGNPVPLILVVGCVVLLLNLDRHIEKPPFDTLLTILSYAAAAYLVVIAFVGLLPLGLVASLSGATGTVLVCSTLHDPTTLREWLALVSAGYPTGTWNGPSDAHELQVLTNRPSLRAIIVPELSRHILVDFMRNRPFLPVSLTCFEECDILFIAVDIDSRPYNHVIDSLSSLGIQIEHEASSFLMEALHKMPLIDNQSGLAFEDYCLAIESETVSHLLRVAPVRMTVFPAKDGPRVLFPNSSAPGLVVERIPATLAAKALLSRDYCELAEVKSGHARTA
jgi:hypothetical protein